MTGGLPVPSLIKFQPSLKLQNIPALLSSSTSPCNPATEPSWHLAPERTTTDLGTEPQTHQPPRGQACPYSWRWPPHSPPCTELPQREHGDLSVSASFGKLMQQILNAVPLFHGLCHDASLTDKDAETQGSTMSGYFHFTSCVAWGKLAKPFVSQFHHL